jgi:tape measure domain-containing protein
MSAGTIEYILSVDTKKGKIAIRDIGDAFDNIGKQGKGGADKASNALDRIGNSAKSAEGKVGGLWKQFLGGQMAFRALEKGASWIEGFGTSVIETAGNFEVLRTQLDVVLGSAKKGGEYFEWIKAFSAKTPFQMEELTKATITMENFGINAKENLSILGDTSASLQIDMNELSQIMGKIFVKPNAQAEEMMQLIERGIPVTDILSKKLGITAGQVANIGNEGIRGQEVFHALMEGMVEKYGGAMEKFAAKWTGMVSTLKDNWSLFLNRVAESGVFEVVKQNLKGLLDKLTKWAEDGTLARYAKQISDTFVTIINTAKGIMTFLWDMRSIIAATAKILAGMWVVNKINAWAGAIQIASQKLLTMSTGASHFSGVMKGASGILGKIPAGLKKVGAVAGAAFAGWEIGKLIGEFTGLDKVIQKAGIRFADWLKLGKATAVTWGSHYESNMQVIDQIKSLGSELGVSSNKLRLHALAIADNEDAYSKLSPEAKKTVDRFAKLADVQEKVIETTKKTERAVGPVADLMHQYGLELDAAQKLYLDLNPEQKELNTIMNKYSVTAEKAQKIIKALNDAEERRKAALGGTILDVPKLSDAQNDLLLSMIPMPNIIDDTTDAMGKFKVELKPIPGTTKEWGLNWKDANEVIEFSQHVIDNLTKILGALGIELSAGLEGALQFGEGIAQIGAAISSGNLAGVVSGVTSAVSGLIKAIKGLFSGDGVGEAISRENAWMHLNDELRESLHKLAEEVGDTHTATSMMLSDIMDQSDVTVDNFDRWANRVKEIFIDLDNGFLSQKDFMTSMGSAWNSLVDEAQRLGTEGSTKMLEIIREMRNRGLEIKEITEYIDTQLRSGVNALQDYVSAGGENVAQYSSAFFESLKAEGKSLLEIVEIMGSNMPAGMKKFVEENRNVLEGISATQRMMEALGNTSNLTESSFSAAQQDAMNYYNQLRLNNVSHKQALEALAPLLGKQIWYAEQYGFELDDNTKRLIEQAEKQGLNLDNAIPAEERMVDALEMQQDLLQELVDIFDKRMPRAIGSTIDAYKGMNHQAALWADTGLPGGVSVKNRVPVDVMAAGGFDGYTTRPTVFMTSENYQRERVIIQNPSQMRNEPRSESYAIHVGALHVEGDVTPEALGKAGVQALRDNRHGFRDAIVRVVREQVSNG